MMHRIYCVHCDQWKNETKKVTRCTQCRSAQKAIARLKRETWTERTGKIATRAKQLNVPFNLTPDFLQAIFEYRQGRCFYTDYTMSAEYGKGLSKFSLSVDRVVPAAGYVKTNIVLCTNQANVVKSNLTLDELREWMPEWYGRLAFQFDLGETE